MKSKYGYPPWKKKTPDTRRHCLVCDKVTIFEFMPFIGHSRCSECGGYFVKHKGDKNE